MVPEERTLEACIDCYSEEINDSHYERPSGFRLLVVSCCAALLPLLANRVGISTIEFVSCCFLPVMVVVGIQAVIARRKCVWTRETLLNSALYVLAGVTFRYSGVRLLACFMLAVRCAKDCRILLVAFSALFIAFTLLQREFKIVEFLCSGTTVLLLNTPNSTQKTSAAVAFGLPAVLLSASNFSMFQSTYPVFMYVCGVIIVYIAVSSLNVTDLRSFAGAIPFCVLGLRAASQSLQSSVASVLFSMSPFYTGDYEFWPGFFLAICLFLLPSVLRATDVVNDIKTYPLHPRIRAALPSRDLLRPPPGSLKAIYGIRAICMLVITMFHQEYILDFPKFSEEDLKDHDNYMENYGKWVFWGVKKNGALPIYTFIVISTYFYMKRHVSSGLAGQKDQYSIRRYFSDIWNRTVCLSPVVLIVAVLRHFSPILSSEEVGPHFWVKTLVWSVTPFADLALPSPETMWWPSFDKMGLEEYAERPPYVFWWIGLELQLIWIWLPLVRVVSNGGRSLCRKLKVLPKFSVVLTLLLPASILYVSSLHVAEKLAAEAAETLSKFWPMFYFRPFIHVFSVSVGCALAIVLCLIDKYRDTLDRTKILTHPRFCTAVNLGISLVIVGIMQKGPFWYRMKTEYTVWRECVVQFTWLSAAFVVFGRNSKILSKLCTIGTFSWSFMTAQVGFRTTIFGLSEKDCGSVYRLMPCFDFKVPFTWTNFAMVYGLCLLQGVALGIPLRMVENAIFSLLRIKK